MTVKETEMTLTENVNGLDRRLDPDHFTKVNSSQCFSSKEGAEITGQRIISRGQIKMAQWRPSREKYTNTTFGAYTIMSNSVADYGFEILGK